MANRTFQIARTRDDSEAFEVSRPLPKSLTDLDGWREWIAEADDAKLEAAILEQAMSSLVISIQAAARNPWKNGKATREQAMQKAQTHKIGAPRTASTSAPVDAKALKLSKAQIEALKAAGVNVI